MPYKYLFTEIKIVSKIDRQECMSSFTFLNLLFSVLYQSLFRCRSFYLTVSAHHCYSYM